MTAKKSKSKSTGAENSNRSTYHATSTRRSRRQSHRLTTLDEIEFTSDTPNVDAELDETRAMQRVYALIQALKPVDRQVIILHLEGLAADEIANIVGISSANTHTKLTRVRQLLASKVGAGDKP